MPQPPVAPFIQSHQPPLRIAINGFGRIGRNVLRVYLDFLLNPKHNTLAIEIVAINDIGDRESLLHLLKYDSTHGRLDSAIRVEKTVNGFDFTLANQDTPLTHTIAFFQIANPKQLPWQALHIDLVLECTGHFRQYHQAYQHITAGAKQVIISAAPFDEVDACIVMGVNQHALSRELPIISSVSCTTQALVPLLKIVNDHYGIESAMLTEIHAVTADQTVLDQVHRDLRRARASGHNIIPTTSSSIAAAVRVLPEMAGKIDGYSIRVPTINVAAIDVTCVCQNVPKITDLNQLLQQMSQSDYAGIMGYTDEPLVSSDFIGQPQSLVIDSLQTMQIGKQIKLFAWYDNEWGYANRLIEMGLWLAKNNS